MYIDFKITTWDRFHVRKEDEEEILNLVKQGKINTEGDISGQFDPVEWEKLTDVDEYMTPEENDGFATLQIFNEEHEILHANGKH